MNIRRVFKKSLIEATTTSYWTTQILTTVGFIRIWTLLNPIAIVKIFRL